MSPKQLRERIGTYKRLFQSINDQATALEALISKDRSEVDNMGLNADMGKIEGHASDARISADDAMEELARWKGVV